MANKEAGQGKAIKIREAKVVAIGLVRRLSTRAGLGQPSLLRSTQTMVEGVGRHSHYLWGERMTSCPY